MNGIYTNLAKKRVEQSKEPVPPRSVPPLSETPATQAQGVVQSQETRKQVSKETRKHSAVVPISTEPQAFDLNIEPYKKGTFIFTYEELDAIDDLKKQLKRRLDLPATQYDIVRAAIHIISEDYRKHGADSLIVQRIRQKKARS
jgi:hypothetical protein